ncbi:hypothetical protein ACFQ38_16635 [Sporosarcina contaminans]|uniref:Uncharacterized protein n=1 Tax=Sporosarcina contaminans TaxID=633403 RepID=A0ABW3U234_9BACL
MQLKWCKGALISANDAEIKANRILRCSILNLILFQEEIIMMELSDVRNELDKTAKKLADFRGSL